VNAKVIHIRSSTGLYGAEQAILGMCRPSKSSTTRASIIVLLGFDQSGRAFFEAARERNLVVEALACPRKVDPLCIARLRQRINSNQNGCTIIHCHDYKSIIYGAIASAGLDVIRIATLHGWTSPLGRLRLYHALERTLLRRFHRVCAVSEDIAQTIAKSGIDGERVVRVTNGVDTDRFQPIELNNSTAGDRPLRLGTAARLAPEKNLSALFRAISLCRKQGLRISLELCGDGPLHAELVSLAKSLGISHVVEFKGRVENLEQWYPNLDAMVLPSTTEGLPLAMLEALACGCPVVATAVGDIPSVLKDLAKCQIIQPGDDKALVGALLRIQKRLHPDFSASNRIRSNYSLHHMAACYEKVYQGAATA